MEGQGRWRWGEEWERALHRKITWRGLGLRGTFSSLDSTPPSYESGTSLEMGIQTSSSALVWNASSSLQQKNHLNTYQFGVLRNIGLRKATSPRYSDRGQYLILCSAVALSNPKSSKPKDWIPQSFPQNSDTRNIPSLGLVMEMRMIIISLLWSADNGIPGPAPSPLRYFTT